MAFFLLMGCSRQILAKGCTQADFKGIYSALGVGVIVFPPPDTTVQGPFTRIGWVEFDGVDKVNFIWTRGSYNGVIYDHLFGGSYTVNPDWTH